MKGLKTILVLRWIICLIAPATIWVQATAQISGTVRDASGAVLPGVQVTVTQVETGISRTTLTNERGFYVLTNPPLDPYWLEASLEFLRIPLIRSTHA